jgi:germination protein M
MGMSRRILIGVIILCITVISAGCFNPFQMIKDWIRGEETIEEQPDGQSQPGDQQTPMTNTGQGIRKRETILYYRDDHGYLVPVTRDVIWTEGIARATLQKIMEDDKNSDIYKEMGLYSAIPAGTEILGLTIRDRLAKIDLSEEAMDCADAKAEELMLKTIVYTLTEFNTVDRVQFMFGGKVIERLKHGSRVGSPIAREDINLIGNVDGSKVTVYFLGDSPNGAQYFVPVTIGLGSVGQSMDVAVRCLLDGPPEGSGLISAIPEGVNVKGMGMKNGVVYLNFEQGIFDYEGSDRTGENIVKALALTLKEYPSVVGVVFLVDEEPAQLPSGMVLDRTVDVPVFVNQYN